ncbi:MAG: PcfK-like family protein [Oscillospiraceae bacterium]|jgi:hypothetical protein|nr:PcfK-like family protein [Oscillospiraceae bacterium]
MSTIIQSAIEKLEKESTSSGTNNKVPVIPIYNHLKKICEQDEAFSELVCKTENTLHKCFDYIYEVVEKEVKERSGTQTVWYSDEKTYETAEEYYRIGEEELERRRAEKKKADEAKRKENEEKRKAESEKRAAESKEMKKAERKKKAAEKKAESKPEPKTENNQLSLFD